MTIKFEGSAQRVNRTFRNTEYFASLHVSGVTYSPNTLDAETPYSVHITATISLHYIGDAVGSIPQIGSFTRVRKMEHPPKFVGRDDEGIPLIRNKHGKVTYLHSRVSDLYTPEVCDLISDPEVSAMVIDHLTHRLAEAESKARANILWSSILEK